MERAKLSPNIILNYKNEKNIFIIYECRYVRRIYVSITLDFRGHPLILISRLTDLQMQISMFLVGLLSLPVHKPAWWAGPFSLTLFTNMVSIGSIRLF